MQRCCSKYHTVPGRFESQGVKGLWSLEITVSCERSSKTTSQPERQGCTGDFSVFVSSGPFDFFNSPVCGTTMETFGLRRTQSLRSLTVVQERSWVMPAPTRWERKSVSQLVQHYQSCADLRSIENVEHKVQVSENSVDSRWRNSESRENMSLLELGRSSLLSRSRSMDLLPQKESSGTRALCALFESKSTVQHKFHSSPWLNLMSPPDSKTGKDCPLPDWRCRANPSKNTAVHRICQVDGGKAMNGPPETYERTSRYSHEFSHSKQGQRRQAVSHRPNSPLELGIPWEVRGNHAGWYISDKISPSLTKGGSPPRQARDRISPSSSVRDRLAVYLSKAETVDSTGGSTQPHFTGTSRKRATNSKMADAARKITVSKSSHDEDDLPPPPPPPIPPRPLDYEGPSESSSLPLPPPKETFSTFYQQRQKSELKRLFKHIHPDLRASLDGGVDDEIIKAIQSENPQAEDAAYQCEVQSMRWIFENWNLDNIGDPHATKKLLDDEELKGGDVRGTSSMFEHIDSTQQMSAKDRHLSWGM
ncbi:hypothetical protein Q5P01_022050 [Channa striata]|uniref:Uncharacterized protein n=1 Tax=Channa striata TaxID=64152 RepID=A0AA88LRA7_CHASR|nr:hypothetical protein Q5P01_022050 [Channa striata]